ncbi:sulfotransferase domain-containing protein, partial [Roseibium sp. RKSG952]|uniref:sulfotransferase domain-containing protein n=1 Tax=Roseibium sp. RKSG952 TaxID=2529384 RepID=UPI0012BC4813
MTEEIPGSENRPDSQSEKFDFQTRESGLAHAWSRLDYRDDDIVIASHGKSGTTWLQQIVCQLIFDGDPTIALQDKAVMLGGRHLPLDEQLDILAAQKHRRFIKTHARVEAVSFSDRMKYIYIARDGRDVAWSMFNIASKRNNQNSLIGNSTIEKSWHQPKARPATEERDPVIFFREWMASDGYPFWPFWANIRSWWNVRNRPNVMFLHYNNLKEDLEKSVHQISSFLELNKSEAVISKAVEHSGFSWMKKNADLVAPYGGKLWHGGGKTFINKGTNGRWKDLLSADDVSEYEARAKRELSPDCAHWLATGRLLSGESPADRWSRTQNGPCRNFFDVYRSHSKTRI